MATNANPYDLSPELMLMAHQLAAKHRTPKSDIVHPKVFVPDGKGGVDEFMTARLRDFEGEDRPYVPYCLVGPSCGRLHRVQFGFECPMCGNKTNWDLTHWNGNKDVKFDGEPPAVRCPPPPPPPKPLSPREQRAKWNAEVEAKRRLKAARKASK
jgi:hypothetical protein